MIIIVVDGKCSIFIQRTNSIVDEWLHLQLNTICGNILLTFGLDRNGEEIAQVCINDSNCFQPLFAFLDENT